MKSIAAVLSIFLASFVLFAGEQAPAAVGNEAPFVEGQNPPPCNPGEIWCLVKKEALYRTVTKQVETRPATFYMSKTPAVYEKRAKQVLATPEKQQAIFVPAEYGVESVKTLVREAHTRLEIVPAVIKEVEEEMVVAPAHEEEVLVPAKYKTVQTRMEVEPARSVWKKSRLRRRRCCNPQARIEGRLLHAGGSPGQIPYGGIARTGGSRQAGKTADSRCDQNDPS
jgi:predicted nucleic-acid-binding protein